MEELIKRLERVIQTGAPDKDGLHPIAAEVVLEVVKELTKHGTNLAEVGTDGISRQQAIDALIEYGHGRAVFISVGEAVIRIEQLPPAQPERIRGRWIESDAQNILMKNFIEKGETWRVCDKCGAGFMIGYQYESDKIYHETFHNFCPKCGAKMEVTE